MAALATINWKAERYAPGREAYRTWLVSEAPDGDTAIIATGAFVGQQYGPEPSLAIAPGGLVATRISPNVWTVETTFTLGQFDSQKDKTAQAPRIRWEPGNEGAQTDADADGNALLNSAGTPFAPVGGSLGTLFLYVQRWEPAYNVQRGVAYNNALNNDSVNPFGAGLVEPGQMVCRYYKPARDYTRAETPIPVEYCFELRKGRQKDDDGLWDGFKHRLLDAGYTGWYKDPNGGGLKPGAFVIPGTRGRSPREPVLLDGTGQPITPGNLKVMGANEVEYDPVSFQDNNGKNVEQSDDGSAYFIKRHKLSRLAMSALNLF